MQNLSAFLKCVLNLNIHTNYLEILLKVDFDSKVWDEAQDSAFLTSSQVFQYFWSYNTLDHLYSVPFQKGFVEGTLPDILWQSSVLCFPINI